MQTPEEFEFVQVVGDGAIGSLVCAGMETLNQPYGRSVRSAPAISSVRTYQGRTIALNSDRGKQLNLSQHDLLLLPIKVYQLESVLEEWAPLLHSHTTIMLLQNGMGGEECVKARLPHQPLFIASTSHGAYKSTGFVEHTGLGTTKIGSNNILRQSWQANAVMELIRSCLGPVVWEENITLALWVKLAVNAVINPLTALHNIPNGDLTRLEYQNEIRLICEEISAVMASERIFISARELVENSLNVAAATANNFSSMHQDVKYKRQTEIDSINGFIVMLAKKKGIDVPINTLLLEQIKLL
ncbi:2-dehydropantoate 2-reductase [Alteromonas ponticola]|uniref:2-dehydropantoate 2-reductase n=1 Tax=Alteromonas aquimaris TaxID=2998417 RepID=A0ABT3P4K2_9ALTE|nr:2-dehydropantoate 2-reductase [Alteromonas aquimaris]MCW8107708.1 2-dehydropantoate 2-reductase [Alteromonas aquimaris]